MNLEERMSNRLHLMTNLSKYIEESVYYRSFSSEINENNRLELYQFGLDKGEAVIK